MSPIPQGPSGTTWSPVRRALPISQKTISILLGTCIAAGAMISVIITVALLNCRVRQRRRKLASQANAHDLCSPHSFIQSLPTLAEAPVGMLDVQANHTITPFPALSSNTTQEGHLDGVMSTFSQNGPEESLVGIALVNGSFANHHRPESSESTYSTSSLSPRTFSVLRSQSAQPLITDPSLDDPASPSVIQAEIYPEPRTERSGSPQGHVMKVMDVETIPLHNTSDTRFTSRSLTRSLTSPPAGDRDDRNKASRLFSSFPGLPSSPAASLSRPHLLTDNLSPRYDSSLPHTTPAFLDGPPMRKLPLEPHVKGHLRSRSHSSALPRTFEQSRFQTETSNFNYFPNYASVAYAKEKALRSSRPLAKSEPTMPATSNAREPRPQAMVKDRDSMQTESRKLDKELLSLLSSRHRSRSRSHTWSMPGTGGEPPERI